MAVECDKCEHIMTDEEHEDYPQCPVCYGAYCTKVRNRKCNCDCCMEKQMKKKICDLKPGTPFRYGEQVFIMDRTNMAVRLTDGRIFDKDEGYTFKDRKETLVTVCRRIRKSDIKERK